MSQRHQHEPATHPRAVVQEIATEWRPARRQRHRFLGEDWGSEMVFHLEGGITVTEWGRIPSRNHQDVLEWITATVTKVKSEAEDCLGV